MTTTDESMFWELIEELQFEDPRVEEGTIMGGRCARVAGEFLGLVDFKGSGLVVKLPRARVEALIDQGIGQPFAPAGKVFKEWVSIPSATDAAGEPCSERASPSSPRPDQSSARRLRPRNGAQPTAGRTTR